MRKLQTPVLLTIIGFLLFVLLQIGSTTAPSGRTLFPLLARLATCELGFIICAIGVYIGFKSEFGNCRPGINSLAAIGSLALAIYFAFTGFQIWPL